MPAKKRAAPVRFAANSYSVSLTDEVAKLHAEHLLHERKSLWFFFTNLEEAGVPEWFIRQTMVALMRSTAGHLEAYTLGYIKAAIIGAWQDQNQFQQPSGVIIA